MTISNTTNSITVNGDGLTTTFSYDFYMAGSASYAVLVFTDTDGSETTITSSNFSITGVTDADGGTFTYPLSGSPIATSTSLRLSRILPLTQSVAIGNQGNFYPSAVEQGLDYLTMIAQQQEGAAAGSLDAQSLFGNPQSESAVGISVPIGSGLSFSGNTLVVSGVSGSGTVTQINTTGSITGGPITGVGTISLSTVTTGYLLANFSGGAAAPQGVQLVAGSGLTFSTTTTSVTITASGGLALITSSTPTSTGTVIFNSIPGTYTHLMLMISGRSTGGASPGVDVNMTFNADGGANYDTHGLQLQNATAGNFNAAAGTAVGVGLIPWSASTANMAGYGEAHIFYYANTGLFKRAKISRNTIGATSVGTTWITSEGGCQWRSTASITSITLTLSAGNWDTGSQISLYGLL